MLYKVGPANHPVSGAVHMTKKPNEMQRRTVLQSAVGLAVAQMGINSANAADGSRTASAAETTSKTSNPPAGKAGDFNFLAGNWQISHRRLKSADSKDWDIFDGEATCWTVLGGVGSIEELRIPARKFAGIGIRLLDVEKLVWSDYWVNGRSGVLTTPGLTGGFSNGVGTFVADDVDGEQPIKVRGVWDRITPNSCRWHQAVSRDGGKSWESNWYMDWVRSS
jgi:hypothetical protein